MRWTEEPAQAFTVYGVAMMTGAASGPGSIVKRALIGADMPTPGVLAYGMTKSGVNILTRTAACQLGTAGIRVSSVASALSRRR